MRIPAYPSIHALGHKALEGLLDDPVVVQEKVDGSQISFGLLGGELCARSKGADLNLLAPDKLFQRAVESIQSLADQGLLTPGWIYRGEYLAKPKHNALAYQRVPRGGIALFDIDTGGESYLPVDVVSLHAFSIGLEAVPTFYAGTIETPEFFRELLNHTSFLGGQQIEGVVVKNYARFGKDHKALMGKFVGEAFKEVHAVEWKVNNPGQNDLIEKIRMQYGTPARWNKARQHLADAGALDYSPRDIPALCAEVADDVEKECSEEIAAALYKWGWPQIRRGLTRGLPEWYKDQLLEKQFEGD